MSNKNTNIPALITGSCVRGILRAAAGFVFASKPDRELRKDINVRSKQVIEKAEDWK